MLQEALTDQQVETVQRLAAFKSFLSFVCLLIAAWVGFLLFDGDTDRAAGAGVVLLISAICYALARFGHDYVARVGWLLSCGIIMMILVHLFGGNADSELYFLLLLGLPFLLFSWSNEFPTVVGMGAFVLGMSFLAYAHDLLPLRDLFVTIEPVTTNRPALTGFMTHLTILCALLAQIWYFSRITQRATHRATQAMEEAALAAQSKSDFLANMSHEIRTPMNGIVGMIEILRSQGLSEKQNRAVNTIHSSAFSLLRIIDDILDASKIESGKLVIDPQTTELLPLIEGAALTVQPLGDNLEVKLHLIIHPKTPEWVITDAGRLRQILLNLLSNATKFSARRLTDRIGMVRLHVRPAADGSVLFTVTDNGIGMNKTVQSELFQPFAAGESRSRKYVGGTGLGLAITRELIDMLGGKIKVRSKEGLGTKVTVRLPMPRAEGPVNLPDISGLNVVLLLPKDAERAALMREVYTARLDMAGANLYFVSDLDDLQAQAPAGLVRPVFIGHQDLLPIDSERMQRIREHCDGARFVILSAQRDAEYGYIAPDCYRIQMLPTLASDLFRALHFLGHRLEETPAAAGVEDAAPVAHQPLNGQRLLVAEDNDINQTVLASQLNLLGYEHEIVDNGQAALKAWQTGRYALVLTDCQMPQMDGFQLTRAIRAIEDDLAVPPTPIIAITARANHEDAQECLAAGMDDYLAKPIEIDNLRSKIEAQLARKMAEDRS